jgi:hypothetical protein
MVHPPSCRSVVGHAAAGGGQWWRMRMSGFRVRGSGWRFELLPGSVWTVVVVCHRDQ